MANEIRLKLAIDGGPAVSSEIETVGKSLTALGGSASAAAGNIEQALGRVNMSSKQTVAALRGIPAQFTDIVVSLQSGQAPLTVLLQQGGQLKDMFGGVGNAAKALGGYVLGLVNPYTAAAAAVGGLAVAYESGAAESRELSNALILSGNSAGTSSSAMMAMAASIDKITGTQGGAVSALAQVAQFGKVGADHLEKFTTTAIRFEKVSGVAVSETAKKFAELKNSPLEATVKYGDSMGYLTVKLYDQVRALTETGRATEAATIAQAAFDASTSSMTTQMEKNLGIVERSWSKVKSVVAETWDAIKGIGRDAGLEGQVAAAQKMVDVRRQAAESIYATKGDKDKLSAAQNQLLGYQELLKNQQLSAKYEGERVEAAKNYVAWQKEGDKYTSKQEKMTRELTAAAIAGQREILRGTITQQDLEIRFANIREANKEDAGPKARKLVETISDYQKLARIIAEKQSADDLQLTTGSLLTESDKIRAKMLADLSLGAIRLTASEIALAETGLRALAVTEQQIAADKFYAEQSKKRFDASSALVKSAVDEAEKNEELARTFGMTKAAIEQLELARLEEQLAQKTSIGQCTAETAALESLIDAKKRNLAAVGSLDAQKAGVDAAKVTADEWKKTSESINSTLTDALMRGFESGKGAFDNMWDSIKNTLKTSVLKVLIQPVTGALTSMTMSGMAAAGQIGGGNALTNLSAVQSLKSLYDTASGGLNVGAKLGQYLVDNVGNQLVGEFAAGMTNVASMQSATMAAQAGGAQLAGVIAGSVLNGVSGYGISKALSGGFSIDGFNVNAIAGIASMIPVIGPIAGVIGGLVNRAFGQGATEVRAQGTEGTFSSAGFSGNNYANLHRDGGWFSSDSDWKTTSALSGATAKAWGDAFAGVKVSVAGMAAALGLSTASINGYSKSINLAAGASAETITAMFTGMADDMATALAPGLSQLAKEGETSSVTLSRLGTSLTTTNSWLSLLRQRLLGVSLSGGEAASKLADAFGGLDKLTSSAKSFYETYYTEGERSARSMDDMTKALSLVGLALPDSKDALKALAGTLDLTTDSGRTAYAVLLAIAPEYAATADTLAKLSKETADKLMATFTGGGLLVPALDAARLHVGDFTGGVQMLTGDLSFINKIMGDASSGVISFGSGVVQLDTGLSQSQLSAGLLTGQMDALRDRADKTRIDFDGLSVALFGVKTGTVASQIDAVNAYLAGVKVLPVGTSIADANAYLAGVKALPVGASVDSVNAYLRGLQALPVGTSIADANAYLAGVKAVPVGASVDLVNAYLRGLQALPVGTSIADANYYLASIKALPVGAAIDVVNASLNGISTGTFVSTIEAVFANLATRISSVIGDISAERMATVSAALQIINPTVMSKAAISRGVAGIDTALPSNSGVVAAQKALTAADALVTKDVAVQAGALARYTNAKYAVDAAASSALYSVTAAKNRIQDLYNQHSNIRSTYSLPDLLNGAVTSQNVSVRSATSGREVTTTGSLRAALAKLESASASNAKQVLATASAQSGLNELLAAYNITIYQTTSAQGAATAAAGSAKQAALDYAKSLQTFAIDASKSVSKLTKLREETVKYYDAQKALASLMTTSAANIRGTVTAYTFSQKTDEQKYQDLAGQFSTAYSMSKITTGETLAGYGDKINALINPMIDALSATGRDSLIANYLAQAEAVALSVDSGVVSLGDYQADSLSMLGSIDATLAALDTSSQSAERIISDAVKAGSDKTAAGLHAVVAALTGQAIPAFASGGAFTNGVVSRPTMFNMGLMGEAGDEGILPLANVGGRLGVHARLGGGGGGGNTARLEALVERQAQQLEAITRELVALRREAAATSGNTSKMVKQGDRIEVIGMPVRNANGAALETAVVAP